MARYKIPGYPSYVYDTETETVISYKSGQPKPLAWRKYGGQLSVKLYGSDSTNYGIGTEMSKFKIRMSIQQELDAKQKESSMQRGNFIIGSIDKNTGAVSFSRTPKQHNNQSSASTEAERLAMNDPSKNFVVAEIKGVVSFGGVSWK